MGLTGTRIFVPVTVPFSANLAVLEVPLETQRTVPVNGSVSKYIGKRWATELPFRFKAQTFNMRTMVKIKPKLVAMRESLRVLESSWSLIVVL